MPAIKVDINPKVLLWALNRSGKRLAVEKNFPKIYEWIEKKSKPTFRQLEELAKATYTPLGYFFLDEPPEDQLPIPYFRTINGEPISQQRFSLDLIETVQMMQLRQDWMREYLIELGQEPLPFVNSAKLESNPHEVAQNIRNTLGLKTGWASQLPSWTDALKELRDRIEDIGIIVVVNGVVGNNTHRKLNPEEFRGFVLVDEYVPLIFINGADAKAAQMFTIAHELAHIWFGSSAAFDLRELQPSDDKIEQICNLVAAEFLLPEDELQRVWPKVKNEPEPFQTLAKHFKVSEIVAARRVLDIGYITKSDFLKFYNDYQAKERSTNHGDKGGNFYNTQNMRIGRRFAKAVITAVKEGKLLPHEAYQLTGLYGTAFDKYAKYLGLEV
ncbi:ImmA/IrrE family metallo-endopeptidase [Thermoanaerobacter sp. CM-CNRG TB177]|jgi:Zn-dependent peptidase ImmA (M78 family)/transcriptional regulator with XRE-family HTH domain|uniref:DNA-binding protein n=1 Tax=Caldanaerobacter subterraneus TaxID=911092 RepID=A0A357VKR8_9THEO|nr:MULTISPECIES: ImmA/IrrE family metallo-endopeptidase [Thermoanaerobacteraceae]MBT1280457.1 ImmA/IrrE family metallo-endopeptidase [Thermoanaerobacter sp. CM-CNRG TB177]TCO55406.1 Zn-dependent peptidase ImmA (M78 family) [Caldanaerobacter subterraneus]HBT48862.1 DNA-binding protein [Caldanaerobacter subterraneus]